MMAILDYRTAVAARDAFNAKDRKAGFEMLRDNPSMLEMLSKMHRAQAGLPLNVPDPRAHKEGMEIAEAHRTTEEEEEERG